MKTFEGIAKQNGFRIPEGDNDYDDNQQEYSRQDVFTLLWTQAAMISNDIKRHSPESLSDELNEILENPRIPKF